MQAASAARTAPDGACVHGEPISSADARGTASRKSATPGPITLADTARSHTEALLDEGATFRAALTSIAEVTPPDVVVFAGTPSEVRIRFLGPVVLMVRAGGTAGSAAVELGPAGTDPSAPLVEITGAGREVRYLATDVLRGDGQTLRVGPASITVGGAPHGRGGVNEPPQVADDGTAAAGAADLLVVQAGGARITLGHVEASAAVPPRGISC